MRVPKKKNRQESYEKTCPELGEVLTNVSSHKMRPQCTRKQRTSQHHQSSEDASHFYVHTQQQWRLPLC
jgi:hypothetical protein